MNTDPKDLETHEHALAGELLYGDDLDDAEVERWFKAEREGYASVVAAKGSTYRYAYHALNSRHGYRHLGRRTFRHVVGIGSAYGDELIPITGRAAEITIVEPSKALRRDTVGSSKLTYVEPNVTGSLPFESSSVDLIVCLGVLHHIPRVSQALREFSRVLCEGGTVLLREPTISMGDWRQARPGLTARERGIPLRIFRQMIAGTGLTVLHETRCMFSLTGRLARRGVLPYNHKSLVLLDRVACAATSRNSAYHPRNFWQRFRPVSVFYVLQKGADVSAD